LDNRTVGLLSAPGRVSSMQGERMVWILLHADWLLQDDPLRAYRKSHDSRSEMGTSFSSGMSSTQ